MKDGSTGTYLRIIYLKNKNSTIPTKKNITIFSINKCFIGILWHNNFATTMTINNIIINNTIVILIALNTFSLLYFLTLSSSEYTFDILSKGKFLRANFILFLLSGDRVS